MPPPSLSMTTIRTGVSTSRSAARPPMSCRRPRSPVTIVVGRPLAWAAPIPEETRPSIPLAPRLQRKRASACSAPGTPPGRGSACSRRCRRGRRRGGRGRGPVQRRLGRPGDAGSSSRLDRLAARRARRAIHASGAPRSSVRAAPPSPPRARSGRRAGAPPRAGSARSSRRAGRRRSGRRPLAASHARSGLLVGISPKRRTRSGDDAIGEALVAQQQVVGRDHVRAVVGAAAQLRGRLGEDREAGGAARWASGSRSSGSSWRPATITPDDRVADVSATSSSRKLEGSRSTGVTAVSGRRSRPSSASGSVAVTAPSTATGASGSRQGEVEVDRTRARLARAPRRSARQATER